MNTICNALVGRLPSTGAPRRGTRPTALFFLCASVPLWFNSPAQAQTPIRISGDSSIRYPSVIDSNTLQSVQWVRGDFLTIEVGLFDHGNFVSNNIARFASLNFELFQSQSDTNAPMMSLSVTNAGPGTNNGWNTNCTWANWTNGPSGSTNQEVVFNFTDAQSSIPLNGQASQSYWIRIFGVTTDAVPRIITYLETSATIYDGPISASYATPAWTGFVTVNNSGALQGPNNFFTENVVLIEDALLAAGFSGSGGGSSTVLAGTNINVTYQLVGANNEPVVSAGPNLLTNGEHSTIIANGGIVNNGSLLNNGPLAATGAIGTAGAMYANGFTNISSVATNLDTPSGRTNTVSGTVVEARDANGNLTLAGQVNASAAGLYGTVGATVSASALSGLIPTPNLPANVQPIATNNGRALTNLNVQDTLVGWPYAGSNTTAILAGDSLTSALLVGGSNYFFYLTNQYGFAFASVTNTGVPGQWAYGLMTNFQDEIGQYKPGAGTNCVAFVWAGINDLPSTAGAAPTITVSNVFSYLTNIWCRCHTNGMKVVAFEVTPSLIHPEVEANRVQLNAMIYNSSALWDYLVQVAVPDPASAPTFYADGVTHYNTNAYWVQGFKLAQTLIRSPNMQHGLFESYLLPLAYVTAGSNNYNVFLGHNGNVAATGQGNTASGWIALNALAAGANNVADGYAALYNDTSGGNNLADGYGAMFQNTTGSSSTAVGFNTLFNATTPNGNTAVGSDALYYDVTGAFNWAGGEFALYSNTASYNTASGANAMNDNTTGYNNTADGYGAMFSNITAIANVASGYASLFSMTGGNGANTAIGATAMYGDTTGANNTAVGYQSLFTNTTGSGNTAVGYQAAYSSAAIGSEVAIGTGTLYSNLSGANNTAVGYEAMFSDTSGANDAATGYASLFSTTTGTGNTGNGYNSLFFNTTGNGNTGLGYSALQSNVTASYSTAVGYAALQNSTGADNTAIGANAAIVTTGANNTAVGYDALLSLATASDEVAVGYGALLDLTTGAGNTAVGYEALGNDVTGAYNSAVGYFALVNATGTENTALGYQALDGASGSSGNYNTAVGVDAGQNITSGSANTFVGLTAGQSVTTGSYNTIVGAQVTGSSAMTANTILANGNGTIVFQDFGNGTVSIPSAITTPSLTVTNLIQVGPITKAAPFILGPNGGYYFTNEVVTNASGRIVYLDLFVTNIVNPASFGSSGSNWVVITNQYGGSDNYSWELKEWPLEIVCKTNAVNCHYLQEQPIFGFVANGTNAAAVTEGTTLIGTGAAGGLTAGVTGAANATGWNWYVGQASGYTNAMSVFAHLIYTANP